MFDTHYDLLTLVYMAQKENINIDKQIKAINQNNVSGVFANLYFMSKKEMQKELKYPKKINVIKMFKQSKKSLEKYNLDAKIIYSIEGCDYIKHPRNLKKLKKLGLNAILPVWNNKNKYGSGIRTNQGLSKKGKKLIQTAIDLGLGIDLSHANKQTFNDIIEIIKQNQKQKKTVNCYASHSNIREIQDNPRNLTKEELKKLKEVNGYLGIVSYPKFITNEKENKKIRQKYIEHIKYATQILTPEKIMLASDNMDFINLFDTGCKIEKPVYNYRDMKKTIQEDLKPHFNKHQITKIMYTNAETLYQKITKSQK